MRTIVFESTRPVAGASEAHRDSCNVTGGPARHLSAPFVHGYVRLEIRADRLSRLMNDKVLVLEDLRAIDGNAKDWLKRLLLEMLTA